MTITHDTALRAALAEAVPTFVDTGAGTAVVRVRDVDGVTLIEFDLPNPSYVTDLAGAVTVLGIPISAVAVATGAATNFIVLNRDGNAAYQGSVGVAGSGSDLEVTGVNVISGQNCALLAHAYHAPV